MPLIRIVGKHKFYLAAKLLLLLLAGTFITAFIPQANHFIEVKRNIDFLFDKDDLMGVNRLLNQNTDLDKEYIFTILNKSIERAAELNNKEALAYSYLSLGNFWFMQGNTVNAYDNYFQCETICRVNKIEKVLATAIMNRSNLSKNFEERKQMLLEAISYFSKSYDSLNLAKAHLNLGNIYSSLVTSPQFPTFSSSINEYFSKQIEPEDAPFYKDSAFFHYQKAEAINQQLSHHELSASLHLRYAAWFMYEKKYHEAAGRLINAEHHFHKASLIKGEVFCIIQLSDIKKNLKNYRGAISLLDTALEKSIKYKFDDYQADICKTMVELFELTGDTQKALFYQKEYTKALIHLNSLISEDKIHALNLEYSLKDQQYLIQSMVQKRKINNLILFLISVLCLSAVIFAYLVIVNRRRKIQSLSESMARNKRLNAIEMELMQTQVVNQRLQAELLEEKVVSRSENLMQIANQLNKLESYYVRLTDEVKKISENYHHQNGDQKLNRLKLSLLKIAEEQKSLKEKSSFSQQINQDFFFHIEKYFSKTTKDDKLLLSYLISGMNSKEISQLLHISTESVNKKRYRLRKKLNIPPEQNFQDFYFEITRLYTKQ